MNHTRDAQSAAGKVHSAPPLDQYTAAPKQDEGRPQSPFYQAQAPSISLPKGGGALKGIDEKFTVNAVNGTAALQVPFPLSPGRGGFTPALSVGYNSGSGNSEFGLGWSLGLGAIQRKTDKKLPRYDDANDSDVFLLAGAEDLIPQLKDNSGEWEADEEMLTMDGSTFLIRRYRPRIEGLFARIEHIRKLGLDGSWWRVTTKDNITTYYGLTPQSRICDPADNRCIFRWLPELVVDHKGNAQLYTYAGENFDNVPVSLHEKNRYNGTALFTNRYLKTVSYCNLTPFYIEAAKAYLPTLPTAATWLMQAVLDYGDHSMEAPQAAPNQLWACRKDPFSDYHPSFEMRCYRKCRRVLVFHAFSELSGGAFQPVLVRSLDFSYHHDDSSEVLAEADYITAITQSGYEQQGSALIKKSLPAMTLDYQQPEWNTDIHPVAPEDIIHAPQGLSGPYQWTDLYGEGLPGILTEQGGGWFYKRNLGDACFTPAVQVAEKPSLAGLGQSLQWEDLDADGRRMLVSRNPSLPGYFELNDAQEWEHFKAFPENVNVNWSSPFTKVLDLDGDGRPDLLLTEDRVCTWYRNKGTGGISEGGSAPLFADEEKGPRLLLTDEVQRIFLADMSGDGLTDLVRISNREVCYWPNMGYGRFGAKVTMSHAPQLDHPDDFNPAYLHLADITGTGAADLLYLGQNNCTAYLNLSGNGWSLPFYINPLPSVEADSRISVTDLLGNGTACIVWSSPLPQFGPAPLRYIDLMGGKKPYLLHRYRNGMGKEVSISYKSSARYYLEDKAAGRPWATRLPFPVHCIDALTTTDAISETSYTQSFRYHHGYYDHEEREFRGFGRVDTLDAESAASYEPGTALYDTLDQPPVLTKTWYHTGAWMQEQSLAAAFGTEYCSPGSWPVLAQPARFPDDLAPVALREAHRALKGSPLRQEVYALDGSDKQDTPYTVTAYAYEVKRVQPRTAETSHAAFLPYQKEKLAISCERHAADPRIAHELTLETDRYGHVLQSAQVAYARRDADTSLPAIVQQEQARMHVVYAQHHFTNDAIDVLSYRLRLPCEQQSFELLGLAAPAGLWTATDLLTAIDAAAEIDFSAVPSGAPEKRLLSHSRQLYKPDSAASTPLPLGILEPLALPHEQYQLALTAATRTYCYGARVTAAMLAEGGFEDLEDDGSHWLPSGTAQYTDALFGDAAQQFYTPLSFTDPWGHTTLVSYWGNYWLLPESVTDALGNETGVIAYNWRCLQPVRLRDANGNFSEMLYDALGLPVAMALKGKDDGTEGDSLAGLAIDSAADAALQHQFFNDDPDEHAAALLQDATWRCVYRLDSLPAAAGIIARQHHVHNPLIVSGQSEERLVRLSYTDGLGRLIMHKAPCAPTSENGGKSWVGSGRTVYNNKGSAVLSFEPYFSDSHHCDTAEQAALAGVSPRLYYDPLNRLQKTELPDGSFSKTEWTAWQQTLWDNNDTVLDSDWYAARIAGALGAEAQDAAQKAAAHHGTPTVLHTDTLARPFYTIQMDGPASELHSYARLDVTGNRLSVVDGRGLTTLVCRYNMLGQPCYQQSPDSGDSYALTDAAGQPLYGWDADGREIRMTYDALRRPEAQWLNDTELLELRMYGEGIPGATSANLRGQLYRAYDGAGLVEMPEYDFKGNALSQLRTFTADATKHPDWAAAVPLESNSYETQSRYDALNRPVEISSPEAGITTHVYERSGSLYSVRVSGVRGLNTAAVNAIYYDAKGQRQKVQYANGTTTTYAYDPQTFRVIRIRTTRAADSKVLQDLNYYYDPVGNITRIRDEAQQTVFFNGSVASPENDYTYDALYRLVQAKGREHAGNNAAPDFSDSSRSGAATLPIPSSDTAKMRRYTQYYQYDAAGNLIQVQHTVTGGAGNWTRHYTTATVSNRLLQTAVGAAAPEVYSYDNRGNITSGFVHLLSLSYNAANCLEKAVIDASRTVYYQYDSSGQRVRKTTVNTAASLTESRYYVGHWEVYRKQNSTATIILERETLHLSDDTGRVALIDTRTIGAGTEPAQLLRYQLSNHLGSAALETDGAGVVISYEEYYPYGSTSGRSGRWAATKRYRYSGKERDEESGFYYHGARYYAPWLCRWLATDPLESKYAGMSPYNYGFNNPVKWTDSTGMEPDGGDNKGGARLETKQPTSGQWEQRNQNGYTGKAAPPFQLDGIMVTPTKSSPVNAGDNAHSTGSADYRWVDISGAKISRYGYSEGGFSDPYNYARFVDNVFFSAWNAVVDVGDAFLNSENTLRATWDYLSYTGSYVANTSAQKQWSDAKADLESMATNIQTYEDVGALLLTRKLSSGMQPNVTIQGSSAAGVRGQLITESSVGLQGSRATETRGYSIIYRAVSKAEVDDIANFGVRMKLGGYETGKLFAPTLEEAAQFGKYNFGLDGIPNTIMKVEVPNNVLNNATKFGADGMDAISIPANQLHLLKAKPLNYSPWLR